MLPRSKGVLKIEKIGRTDKDLKFLDKWSRIRGQGRIRYIITRGIGLGLLLFLMWLIVTIIEISMSEFQKTLYFEHFSNFIEKCMIWFCCYMTLGFILANGIWKRKEEKMDYLS